MSLSERPVQDEFYESLLGDFLDESAQLLDRLNENLLTLDEWAQANEDLPEAQCDENLLNDMFRAAHSLKGLSAMLGLQAINQLTHKVENVFDAARKGELRITRNVVNLIFEAIDRLTALVEALKHPDAKPVEYEEVLEKIHQLLKTTGLERGPSTQADAERALADIEQGLKALEEPTVAPGPAEDSTPAGANQESLAPAKDLASRSPATSSGPSALDTTASSEPAETLGTQAGKASASPHTVTKEVSEEEAVRTQIASADPLDPLADIQDEPTLPTKYVGIFIDEASETLDQLTEILLATEGEGQKETVESLMVLAHKLKGAAASIGLHRAAKLAHLMEDVLQGLLLDRASLSSRLVDLLLRGTDALRQFVEGLREGRPGTEHFAAVARQLQAAQQATSSQFSVSAGGSQADSEAKEPSSALPSCSLGLRVEGSSDSPASALPTALSAQWREKVIAKVPEGGRAVIGEVYLEKPLPLAGLKGRLIYEKLCRVGEVVQFEPPPEILEEAEEVEKVSFGLLTEASIQVVASQLEVAGVRSKVLETWPPLSGPTSGSAVQAKLHEAPASAPQPKGVAPSAGCPASASTPTPKQASPSHPRRPLPETSTPEAPKPTETLRVDIERLDELMNLAGQLVISKARFSRIGDSLKGLLSGRNPMQMLERISTALEMISQANQLESKDVRKELDSLRATARRLQQEVEDLAKELQVLPRARQAVYELQEAVHQLDRVTDGLQQTVMQTRMVPIGPLFTRFKRVVRDITRLNGKSARLVILGEKTELDKRMIDELGDPLIHLVRNALDHGIEPPEQREALGKPREGTVTLEAFHRGNSIVIRVSDDGRGLDANKILRKALERGLVSPADAEKMTQQQIYQLIWQPGLSTAEKVTEISGRGMGMDIVWSKISELNGTVEIDSTPGIGTTMTIKLPLTLAILPSLMIEIDGDTFALPIEAVAEIVHLKRSEMYTIQGQWVARVRNAVISVVHLRDLFTWSQPTVHSADTAEQTTLVILGETDRQIGLAVDRVLGEEDVVIKSISENYHNVPGLAGASILGDGRVALILDVTALVEMASGRATVSSC